jgi:CheY-like chemotaxis protein
MTIIAVFSGIYCATEEIVGKVADRLGYTPVGDRLLEEAALGSGLPREKVERSLAGERGLLNAFTHDFEKSLIHLKAALARHLGSNEQIVTGPASLLIPPSITHTLWVEVTAMRDFRIERAQARHDLDVAAARKRIDENDEEISRWVGILVNSGLWSAERFDLRIPTPGTSVDEAVELICKAETRDALRPTDSSIQAVADFRMATEINLALLERGRYYCDVTVENRHVTVEVSRKAGQGQLAQALNTMRFENIGDEVREICKTVPGIESVEVRPGGGYRRPSRTLLVDDEREYVVTLSERLGMRNIPSDVAYDGPEALSYMKTTLPDVMVLDLRMPGMDGLEVLRRTRAEHPEIEIIVVTGHGSEADEKAARELGAFDYLNKPVDINILAERIQAASEKAQQRRQATESSKEQ